VIGLNWVMLLPDGLSEERFESWYLGVHTLYLESAPGVKRYTINRAVSQQPPASSGGIYRVAQEYWADWDATERFWNSASGHVLLGDGLVNMGLDSGTIRGVAVTEDVQLDVARPAVFSAVRGGYRGRPDGTITKFLAFGLAGGRDLGNWYRGRFGALGGDPRVREHVFGTGVGRRVPVGYLGSIPAPEQELYDWLLELWFDSNEEALGYLGGDDFSSMWEQLGGESTLAIGALFRGQERVLVCDPLPHRDS
jgi:hypothetical protein